MSRSPSSPQPPGWWTTHQQALHLFRDFDALQRVRRLLIPSSLAYQRLEREQARIEAAIEGLRQAHAGY